VTKVTEFLNRCKVCSRTPQQVKKELGVDETVFIGGMCVICCKQNIDLKEIEMCLSGIMK